MENFVVLLNFVELTKIGLGHNLLIATMVRKF